MRRLFVIALAFSTLAGVARAENTDKEAQEAVSTFKKAYASKDESDRISAVEALASTQSKRVVEALAGPLAKDTSPAVRRAAAKALGSQWCKEAPSALLRALNPADPAKDVTTAIVNALGQTESDQAVPALLSLLVVKRRSQKQQQQQSAPQNDGSEFTQPALQSLARIGSARATDDLINFLGRQSAGGGRGGRGGGGGGGRGRFVDPVTKDTETALTSITGQHFTNAQEWRKWWNDNKATLKVIPVYRCTGTGKTFDKTGSSAKCPFDGDQHSSCGFLLKTRFEGGGLGAPDASSDEPKPKKNKKQKPAN